jgi:hypothetical protein
MPAKLFEIAILCPRISHPISQRADFAVVDAVGLGLFARPLSQTSRVKLAFGPEKPSREAEEARGRHGPVLHLLMIAPDRRGFCVDEHKLALTLDALFLQPQALIQALVDSDISLRR